MGEVRILSDAFERKASSLEDPDCIEGFLTGQSKGLKRPTFYREGGHSGMYPYSFRIAILISQLMRSHHFLNHDLFTVIFIVMMWHDII